MAMHKLVGTYLVAHECHFKMLLPLTLLLTYRTNTYRIPLPAAVSAIHSSDPADSILGKSYA